MVEPTKRGGIVSQVFAWAVCLVVIGGCVWSTLRRLDLDTEANNWRPPANPVVKTVSGRFLDVTQAMSYRHGYRFVTDRGETLSFTCEAYTTRAIYYHGCLTNYPEELKDRPITVRYYEAMVHPRWGLRDQVILGLERDGRIVFQRPIENTY